MPKDYHGFAGGFSKAKASVLAPHRDYDLKIDLEEGATLLPGRLYSLSPIKLEALWTFIDKNLCFGFICPTFSSHAAPVLFIKKKDGSLRLCVDYKGLNKISKKDCYRYPLSLTCLTLLAEQRSTLKSTFGMRTIWFALLMVMSGKQPSEPDMAPMSGW